MDDIDARLEQVYRDSEAARYPKVRERLFNAPDIVAMYPEPAIREHYLRQQFDRSVDREIEEIKARPGLFKDNLLTELYVRHAEASFVNDNVRERTPPTPPSPTRERER